jgi:DNA end-binding protein Ku
MGRSVWKGTLSFGLVAIPVSLYPATEPKDVRFHLFDREGRRVRYRRVVEGGPELEEAEEPEGSDEPERSGDEGAGASRSVDDAAARETEVAYEDLVRGYEVEPETYVFLEASEIERARPTPSRVIDLEQFVRLDEIDPIFFEKAYYVTPAPGAEKPYDLLLRALQEAGRVGIGRFVLRTKPHLVAVRPMDRVLALETLFFGDEVRDVGAVADRVGRSAVTEREVDVARELVEVLAADWDPSRFADAYREELMRMIAERTPERLERPSAGPRSRVEDLMDALRRSVEDARAGRRPTRARRAG